MINWRFFTLTLLLVGLISCSSSAETTVPVTREPAVELPAGTEPEGLPGPADCTPLPADMSLTVTAPNEETITVEIRGLQPEEKPVVILLAENEEGSVTSKWQPAEPVGQDGRYSYTLNADSLNEANDFHLTEWQAQVIHARGVACGDVTLP